MEKMLLFTDGSVNTKLKVGYGAYLYVTDPAKPLEELKPDIKLKRFENTSSTKLELEILIWALNEIKTFSGKLKIFVDSQNIISLLARRERLEKNNYYSKSGKRLANYKLYQEFFKFQDNLNFELVKVQGHKQSNLKNTVEKIFTLVDRAARKANRSDTL